MKMLDLLIPVQPDVWQKQNNQTFGFKTMIHYITLQSIILFCLRQIWNIYIFSPQLIHVSIMMRVCQVVMAERWLGCSWKRHVSEQLKLRDRVQRQAFEEIVHQCESCFRTSWCCAQQTGFSLYVLQLLNTLIVLSYWLPSCWDKSPFFFS